MSNELIKVTRGGTSQSFALDPTQTLDKVREILTAPPNSFMTASDRFLNAGSPISLSAEPLIQLSAISGKHKAITIGTGADIGGNDAVQRYNQMSEASIRALYSNIEIWRGLTISASGQFQKTFKNIYDWKMLPAANMPRVITEIQQTTTFNETSHTLETSGVEKGSVSLSSPWGGGSSEYSNAESHSRTTGSVTQYMCERYLSNKVDLDIPPVNIEGSNDFIKAVNGAVNGNEDPITRYQNLVGVLNEWGWYVPLQFTLGGAIFGTRTTTVTSFSQVDSQTSAFGADFKASFDGIGGGSAYSQSNTTTTKDSGSSGKKDVQLLQIGGLAGTANSFKTWNESLEPAVNWNTIKFQKLYPSLMLLKGKANDDLTSADGLLQKFHSYAQVRALQPYLDVAAYELRLAELLNPF